MTHKSVPHKNTVSPHSRPFIAILAAGSASRMRGGDKTLETIDGVPLLRLLAERALATGCPVGVTLAPGAETRRMALKDLPVNIIEVAEAAHGMSASFRALAGTGAPLLVMLADMPEIETEDLTRLIAAFDGTRPVRAASENGTPGQPVLFPQALVAKMTDLAGDTGAREILKSHPPLIVPLPGRRAVTDLDTPEDWAAWRAATGLSR